MLRYAPSVADGGDQSPKGWPMVLVPAFHSSGADESDQLIYHNQSACAEGQSIKKKGTSVLGAGNFRALCAKCRFLADGIDRNDPL